MHLSFKKQNTRLRAVEWLRLGGWTETILMLWGWATTKGVFGSKTKQLGCRLLVTVIWKEGGSGPTRSLVGQWWRSLGKVSCPSERIIVMVICNLDTSGFKSHGWTFWWSAGELSFNPKFLNFQLLFHPYGFRSDTCAALCSLARTFVILNAPLGFFHAVAWQNIRRGKKRDDLLLHRDRIVFIWWELLLEHNIQNGVFIR